MTIMLKSELQCPECGYKSVETMLENACLYFHQCLQCSLMLKPLAGDCCVFCSYGDVACPPVQKAAETGERVGCCR